MLRYIADHTAASIKQMKADLGIATGVLYYHLVELQPYLKQDESKRYYLTAKSRLMLDQCKGDYEAASKLFRRLASSTTSTPDVRKYRSLYDTIASVLDTTDPVFTPLHVVRKAKMSTKRAKELLSFMREHNLIEIVEKVDLPEGYSDHRRRRHLKVTDKGAVFLRRYRELRAMIG